MCPSSRFFSNSVRIHFIAIKHIDFLQLPIMQLLRTFYCNILKSERRGDNFLGPTLEKSQIPKSQLSRKKEQNLNI